MQWQHKLVFAVAVPFLTAMPALGQTAPDVLQAVPEKAAAFLLVNNLGESSDKIVAVTKRLGFPLPFSPLEKVKDALGVHKGLNAKGSVLVVVPQPGEDLRPRPLVFLPVTDYQEFLQGLNAKGDGDIATIQFHGTETIVGRRGSFAVLTDPASKDLLKEALQAPPASRFATLRPQLMGDDVSIVLTTRGIKFLVDKARAGLGEAKNSGKVPAEAQFMLGWLEGIDGFLKSIQSDVTDLVHGVRVDKAGNLRLHTAALFAKDSGFAQAGAKAQATKGPTLAGLPDMPFMMALSGSMTGSLIEEMANVGLKVMTAMLKEVPAEKVAKLQKSAKELLHGLRGMSMIMGLPKEGAGMLQNSYVVVKVKDSAAYLDEYEKYLDAYNDLLKGLQLPQGFPGQSMKSKRTKVAGLPALEVTADMGGENQIELVKKMMEVYFGPGGKLFVTTVAVDKNTLLMRYTAAAGIKDALQAFGDSAHGLAENKEVAKTMKHLPQGSQWVFLVSPQGTVAMVSRVMAGFMPQAGFRLPEFPATPPIGIGIKMSPTELESRLVIPAGVLEGIGAYIQKYRAQQAATSTRSPVPSVE